MPKIEHQTFVQPCLKQMSARLRDETVVLNLNDDHYYTLNPVAARIWALIQNGAMVGDIHTQLLQEFDVESERCMQDLLTVLGDLERLQLIEIGDA